MKQSGLLIQFFRLAMAACFGGLAAYLVSIGGAPAFFAARRSRRWAYASTDPVEFWFIIALLGFVAAACLWSFVRHRDGSGWRR
jgi:hypothetical protein